MNWTVSVNGGPERQALPFSTGISLYHGFRPQDIIVPDPPSGDTVFCGDQLDLEADPEPNLAYQDRIEYCWEALPEPPPQYGVFLNGACTTLRENAFRADFPGDIQIRYRIRDVQTGYYSDWSNPITLHLVPKVTITTPLDDDKFTFDIQNPGKLTIAATTIVNPPQLASSLVWSITQIEGSTLIIRPGISPTNVDFSFTNLPADNDQFGAKKIKVMLPLWSVGDSVNLMVFFPKFNGEDFAFNHPGDQTLPNWYYYWKKTSASRGDHVYGGIGCTGDQGYYADWENFFHVCPPAGETYAVECTDGIPYDGIDNFAVTCIHEDQHQIDWWAWWGFFGGYNSARDRDRDYVPDTLEPGLGFNPTLEDTDGDGHEDFEDRGYDRECDWIWGRADDEDWANPGHQY